MKLVLFSSEKTPSEYSKLEKFPITVFAHKITGARDKDINQAAYDLSCALVEAIDLDADGIVGDFNGPHLRELTMWQRTNYYTSIPVYAYTGDLNGSHELYLIGYL